MNALPSPLRRSQNPRLSGRYLALGAIFGENEQETRGECVSVAGDRAQVVPRLSPSGASGPAHKDVDGPLEGAMKGDVSMRLRRPQAWITRAPCWANCSTVGCPGGASVTTPATPDNPTIR